MFLRLRYKLSVSDTDKRQDKKDYAAACSKLNQLENACDDAWDLVHSTSGCYSRYCGCLLPCKHLDEHDICTSSSCMYGHKWENDKYAQIRSQYIAQEKLVEKFWKNRMKMRVK